MPASNIKLLRSLIDRTGSGSTIDKATLEVAHLVLLAGTSTWLTVSIGLLDELTPRPPKDRVEAPPCEGRGVRGGVISYSSSSSSSSSKSCLAFSVLLIVLFGQASSTSAISTSSPPDFPAFLESETFTGFGCSFSTFRGGDGDSSSLNPCPLGGVSSYRSGTQLNLRKPRSTIFWV